MQQKGCSFLSDVLAQMEGSTSPVHLCLEFFSKVNASPTNQVDCVIPFLCKCLRVPAIDSGQPTSEASQRPAHCHHTAPTHTQATIHPEKKSTGQWVPPLYSQPVHQLPSISQSNPSSKPTKVTLPFRLNTSPSPFCYHFACSLPYNARRGKDTNHQSCVFLFPFFLLSFFFLLSNCSFPKIPHSTFPLVYLSFAQGCSPKQVPPSCPVIPAFSRTHSPFQSLFLAPIAVYLFGRCCCCYLACTPCCW